VPAFSAADPADVAPSPAPQAAGPACTCFRLRSLTRRVTQFYDQALAPAGLKVTQYSLIAHARRRPGAAGPTVSELAAALFTDRTTVTRNLRPLIDAGWLALGPGGDARSKAVQVTPAGEAAFQTARPLWRAAQARVRELTGTERLASLHGLIDELLPLFGADADDGADAPH
jgi:DNA-binding MarR family transcriptional regulator